ncbi:MAG TPA: NAD(P)/FAD-dependent oxidoreductase [Gemmatimonadales bacterium]|nr:NAD(P)/FAD-dependent oxidoreductase [Gemmatimonadales bacterium]
MTRWDAVVVGAGPAGSATARLLAQAGARVLLLDRAQFPRDKPCSEYLSPQSTRVLEHLGPDLVRAVEAAAPAQLYGMKLVAPSGRVAVGRFAADHGWQPPRPYGFALPRPVFDTILRDAAVRAGVESREDSTVEELVYDAGAVGGVVVRTAAGSRETIKARVVIGADGLNSVVARRLGVRTEHAPRRVAYTAHIADVEGVGDAGEMHVGRSGYVGLGPVGGGLTTVALVLPLAAVRADGRDPRRDFFAELERFAGLAGRFDPRRLVRRVLVTGPFARWSRRTTADGALLVGDAADFFDPFTGQGIYAALRGAELAAEVLIPTLAADGPVTAAALAPYRRARRRAFLGKWTLERLIGLGVGWPALAERVIERLARHPALADLLVGATGNFVPARAALRPGVLARLLF